MRCPKRDIANISGGLPGEVPYQTDTSLTTFTNQGNPGNILTIVGSIPTFTPPAVPPLSSVSNDVAGGLANQVLYQSSPSNTTFTNQGTSGQILTIVGVTPTFANPAKPPSVAGGLANEVLYQSAPSVTAFTNQGTNGQVLTIVGSTPTFSTPPSISTNLAGGIAYQVPYQDAPNSTTFTNVGNEGDFLQIYSGVPTFVNFRVPTVRTITSPFNTNIAYTTPQDCIYIRVRMCAGGGGAAGAIFSPGCGTYLGSGGGGASMEGIFPKGSYTYKVGSGGQGGEISTGVPADYGYDGEPSEWSTTSTTITLDGGKRAAGAAALTSSYGGAGGDYGVFGAPVPNVQIVKGGDGEDGQLLDLGALFYTPLAQGGATMFTLSNNDPKDAPPGGRGGSSKHLTTVTIERNGRGGDGLLIIEEYYQ